MGKKTKKPGKGKEKTERKTAKAEEKRARRETKKLSPEDDIDAILVLLHCFTYILIVIEINLYSFQNHGKIFVVMELMEMFSGLAHCNSMCLIAISYVIFASRTEALMMFSFV